MSKHNYFIAIIIAFILLISCNNDQDNDYEFTGRFLILDATPDTTVYVDSTFTVDFESEIVEISGFGCHVIFDSTKINYISSQTYNIFDHENIALLNGKQGDLIIGFNQFDCDSTIKDTIATVFSITFKVKSTAEGQTVFEFDNTEVKKCDQDILAIWEGLNLLIEKLNKFIMRMKLR